MAIISYANNSLSFQHNGKNFFKAFLYLLSKDIPAFSKNLNQSKSFLAC